LTIEVRDGEGPNAPLLPIPKWNPEYAGIKDGAPFWLYVDSGNGLQRDEFSAQLYWPKDSADERSFNRILNFQSLYRGRKITLKTDKFAEFNFPHGTCYSAENIKATLAKVDRTGAPLTADEGEEITVSRKGAIDIDLVSDEKVKREIVLMDNNNYKIFAFPLENGKHYFIDVFNQPKDVGNNGNHTEEHDGQENHFLRYYDMFTLERNEQKVMVLPEGDPEQPDTSSSPPCISGSGDLVTGLP